MNKYQLIVMWIGIGLSVAVILTTGKWTGWYGFTHGLSVFGGIGPNNVKRIEFELLGVILITGGLIITFASPKKENL